MGRVMGRERVCEIPGLSDLVDLAYLAYINLDIGRGLLGVQTSVLLYVREIEEMNQKGVAWNVWGCVCLI